MPDFINLSLHARSIKFILVNIDEKLENCQCLNRFSTFNISVTLLFIEHFQYVKTRENLESTNKKFDEGMPINKGQKLLPKCCRRKYRFSED